MTSISKPRKGRSRAARLAAVLAASAFGATLLQASPAHAEMYTGAVVGKPTCVVTDGVYECRRYGDAWDSNSPDKHLGTRGVWHNNQTRYSPNNTRPSHDIQIDGSSFVWDRTGTAFQRMRLTQTFKVLNIYGATVSVGWGAISVGTTDPATVSATEVILAMTRQAPVENSTMSRTYMLTFPHSRSAQRIENVSSSTIEYGSSNRSYRILNQIPLTDF